jgi:hypothetical protein
LSHFWKFLGVSKDKQIQNRSKSDPKLAFLTGVSKRVFQQSNSKATVTQLTKQRSKDCHINNNNIENKNSTTAQKSTHFGR